MLANRPVHVAHRQFRQALGHVLHKPARAVVIAVDRITQLPTLGVGQEARILGQEVSRCLESRRVNPLFHEPLQLVDRHPGRKMGILVSPQRPQPDLKNLLFTAQVSIRLELKHAAREVFDIGIVAIVHPPLFPDSVEQQSAAVAMLAQIGARQPQRQPIRIAPSHVDRKAKGNGHARCFFFNQQRLVGLNNGWRWQHCSRILSDGLGQRLQIRSNPLHELLRIATT